MLNNQLDYSLLEQASLSNTNRNTHSTSSTALWDYCDREHVKFKGWQLKSGNLLWSHRQALQTVWAPRRCAHRYEEHKNRKTDQSTPDLLKAVPMGECNRANIHNGDGVLEPLQLQLPRFETVPVFLETLKVASVLWTLSTHPPTDRKSVV